MLEQTACDLSIYRLTKAQELLQQAEVLQQHQQYDGSINRSYYAVFSAIRALLALIQLDSGKHSGVIGYFDRYFVKTGIFDKTFSRIAHAAFEARQDSDYEDFYVPNQVEAYQQLEEAKLFIQEVKVIQTKLIKQEIALPTI